MSMEKLSKIVKGLKEIVELSADVVNEDLDCIELTLEICGQEYLLIIDKDGFQVQPE